MTQTGSITDSYDPGGANEQTNIFTFSGAITYATGTCATTDTRQLSIRSILGSGAGGPCDATNNVTGVFSRADVSSGGSPIGCYFWGTDCAGSTASPLQSCCSDPSVVSSTVATLATTACSSFVGGSVSGSSITLTLSNEYTTAQLYADADAAVNSAAWSSFSGTASSAFYSTSSDEQTISMRQFEFNATFSTAVPAGCKFEWDYFLNGVLMGHNCTNLTAGATSFSDFLSYPGGGGTYTVGNFTISSGTC